MLQHSTQSGRHSLAERGRDLYETPAVAVEALLRVEKLPHGIWEPAAGRGAIVTNAPFRILDKFARHALDLAPRVYLLCRLAWYQAQGRTDILEHRGLARVHVFRERLPMMHRDGWNGPRASSSIPFAWYCWNREHGGGTVFDRIGGRS